MGIILAVTGLVFLLAAIYFLYARKQNYSKKSIVEYLDALNIKKPLINSLENVIRKVNGWNCITSIYSILYYSLNVLSIIYSCIGIYFSANESDASIIASILSLISLCLNLFFHCGNKWRIFRDVLAKSRIITDDFLKDIIKCDSLEDVINKYTKTIIIIEKNIKDSDLI